jgi:hypothetical protein
MTITLTREEAQQVLDALHEGLTSKEYRVLVETLRARLSAPEIPNNLPISNLKEDELMYPTQPEPEPVAWRKKWEGETKWEYYEFDRYQGSEPLYTALPQREWQGLTDEEMEAVANSVEYNPLAMTVYEYRVAVQKATSAKLREKNNG